MRLDKKEWFEPVRYVVYAVLLLVYLFQASIIYGVYTKKQIEIRSPIEIRFNNGEIINGVLIGKTSEILFLKRDENISAIPIKSMVKEFEIK